MEEKAVKTAFIAMLAAAQPAAALADQPTIEALQAQIRAQDERIRALEAQLQRLVPAQTAAAPAPASAPRSEVASAPATPPASAPAPAQEEISIRLRGRLQTDALLVNAGDGATPTGTQVRRFYIGAEGNLVGGFRYLADVDVAGNRVSVQDALIAWRASPATELVLGYFKPPNTMDELTSDTHTLFLERSAFSGVFAPGRRVGFAVNHAKGDWGLHAGLFGERDDITLDAARNEGWLVSARAHADLLPGDPVLHLGLSGYYGEPSSADAGVQITQRPEANRTAMILDTGVFPADSGAFGGAELAYAQGPFMLQAEGGVLHYRGGLSEPTFWGYSAQLGWRLTGEIRPYSAAAGVFGRITPKSSIADGGPGALELGLRFGHVDLSDADIAGGVLSTYGVVLNWIPVTRIRLSANLIHADRQDDRGVDVEQTLLALRGAIDW